MSRKRKSKHSSTSDSSFSSDLSSDSLDSLDRFEQSLKNKAESSDSDFIDEQPLKKTKTTATKKKAPSKPKPKQTKTKKDDKKSKKEKESTIKPKTKPQTKPKPKPKPKTTTTTKKKRQVTKKYTVKEGKPLIKNLFKTKNRPFSATNIVDNLESKITTSTVKKVIEELLKEGFITEQSWKKAKIWYTNQSKMPLPDQSVIDKMDDETKTMKEKKLVLLKTHKTNQNEFTMLNSMESTNNITEEVKTLKKTIEEKKEKLEKLKSQIEITPEESKLLNKNYELYRKEWKKRKKIVLDVFSQISEGSGKSLKELYEDAEIETDESVDMLFNETDVHSLKESRGKKRGGEKEDD
ncbi:tbp-1 interacting protein [Anaeramoeba flamelloides]|uniref:Homologous-pairing protein 2 homolog n=1 Tax=Anaeramoeba flamelloides TaxID=1746091 RepID=A0ABQ8XMN8_9EUKA|nr:tbp-1 interacting protein [Anaeramoeba flamelloides]